MFSTFNIHYSAGGKQGSVTRCQKCHGSGIEIKLRQLGPGMMQQMQSTCSDCNGSGKFIREKDRCKKCKGIRVIEVEHKLEVGVFFWCHVIDGWFFCCLISELVSCD